MCQTVVLLSAGTEWRAACQYYPAIARESSPLGEWFRADLMVAGIKHPVIYFHGGWGKIAAAASAQYVIDRWAPACLVNLGTCGGFEGCTTTDTILLVNRTIIYDIIEQMDDPVAAINRYTTDIDLSWLPEQLPVPVVRSPMVSADRDLLAADIPLLIEKYNAIAADWESGAIAYVAARHNLRTLILRTVSDLVGNQGGEAYTDASIWTDRAPRQIHKLLEILPGFLSHT